MDNILYSALSSYYNALEKKGYMAYSHAQKLLVLIFYRDFCFNDYRGILSKDDYHLIERALDCLYGSTCLIPYPDYLKMGKLKLGEITEISQRLKAIENAEVLKLMENISGMNTSDSDVTILAADDSFTCTFAMSPTSVNEDEDSVLHFVAKASKSLTLQIEKVVDGSSEVIYGPSTGTEIDYEYIISSSSAGTVQFVLTATDGNDTITKELELTVNEVPVAINSFTVTPKQIYSNEESTLEFSAEVSKEATLSILDSDGNILCSESGVTTLTYSHKVSPEDTSILKYTLQAEEDGTTQTKIINVEVEQHPYHTMYYGNSTTELSEGSSIQELSSSMANSVSDIYNKEFYYIAVHSSKSLKSVINRDVENVTENFVLKDSALVLDEYGTDQTYKLYECNINEGASSEDMYTFELTINIE